MNFDKSGIIFGPKDDYDIPKKSIGEIIFECLKKRDPRDVINVDAVSKRVLTCGKLLNCSVKVSALFRKLGIKKHDVITIIGENSINYVIPIVAAFYVGAIVNPLNPDYSTGELKHSLLISKPKLILSCENAIETVLKVKSELKFQTKVLFLEQTIDNSFVIQNDVTLPEIESFSPVQVDYKQQVAFIIQSSGTTGLPKGVMITHANLRMTTGLLSHPKYGGVTSADTTIVVVPFFHIYGQMLQVASMVVGIKSVVMSKFKPDVYLRCIEEHKVTTLFTVPPLLLFLATSPLISNYDTSTIKNIFVGAAPLGKELQREASKRLGGICIQQLYGLTETCGPITIQQKSSNQDGSVGTLAPGVVAKVWNPDTKNAVNCLEVGELCFKGSVIMKGYIPAQDCFDEDGFFHSGDVGLVDSQESFHIVGRIKDLIKYKGFQVAPAELEALIITHPSVRDCGVIGVPDDRSGEIPRAFVVLKSGATVTESDIAKFVAERISKQKHLYGGVKFVDEIPKNPSGKIMRRKLNEIDQKSSN